MSSKEQKGNPQVVSAQPPSAFYNKTIKNK